MVGSSGHLRVVCAAQYVLYAVYTLYIRCIVIDRTPFSHLCHLTLKCIPTLSPASAFLSVEDILPMKHDASAYRSCNTGDAAVLSSYYVLACARLISSVGSTAYGGPQ